MSQGTEPHQDPERRRCPDCLHCQGCAPTRCRSCLKGGHAACRGDLKPFMTHGEYEAWKRLREKEKGADGAK